MDAQTKRRFTWGVLLVILFSAVAYALYALGQGLPSLTATALILAGLSVGVFVSYLSYRSFFERERQMNFMPNEELILKRTQPDRTVIIPQMLSGGDAADAPPQEVNLYLTTIGVAAELPGSGEPVLYIPFRDIQEMQTLNRMLLKYLRLRYLDIHGLTSEILVYVGDETDAWAENIGRMLVAQI